MGSSGKIIAEVTTVVYEIMEIRIRDKELEQTQFSYRISFPDDPVCLRRGVFRGLTTQLWLKHLAFGRYEIGLRYHGTEETVFYFEKKPGSDESEGLRIKIY